MRLLGVPPLVVRESWLPRRTAWETTIICSTVTSSGLSCPHPMTPSTFSRPPSSAADPAGRPRRASTPQPSAPKGGPRHRPSRPTGLGPDEGTARPPRRRRPSQGTCRHRARGLPSGCQLPALVCEDVRRSLTFTRCGHYDDDRRIWHRLLEACWAPVEMPQARLLLGHRGPQGVRAFRHRRHGPRAGHHRRRCRPLAYLRLQVRPP